MRDDYALRAFRAIAEHGGFTRAAVKAMQDRLVAAGYDVGKADGLVGYKTRIAIGLWQARHGLAPTCWPDAGMVKRVN